MGVGQLKAILMMALVAAQFALPKDTLVYGGEWERTYGNVGWYRMDDKAALRRAAKVQSLGEPLDWMENVRPVRWRFDDEVRTYQWE